MLRVSKKHIDILQLSSYIKYCDYFT